MLCKGVIYFSEHMPKSVRDTFDLASRVLNYSWVRVVEVPRQLQRELEILLTNLKLLPSIRHGQVLEDDVDLTHKGVKADVQVDDTIGERLDVLLQSQIQEDDIFDFIVALLLVKMILIEFLTEHRNSVHLP